MKKRAFAPFLCHFLKLSPRLGPRFPPYKASNQKNRVRGGINTFRDTNFYRSVFLELEPESKLIYINPKNWHQLCLFNILPFLIIFFSKFWHLRIDLWLPKFYKIEAAFQRHGLKDCLPGCEKLLLHGLHQHLPLNIEAGLLPAIKMRSL